MTILKFSSIIIKILKFSKLGAQNGQRMFELQSLQGILRQSEFPIWQNQDQMKRAPEIGRSFLLFQFFVQHVIGKISRFFKHVPREFRRVVISHEIGHILLPINSMGRERAVYS